MAHLTQHQLTQFFEKHGTVDITFNKHIINSTRMIPGEIYVKCGAKNYSCILNSSSMVGARIIIQANALFFEELNESNKWVSLRFAFSRSDKHFPLTFFIKSKVESFNPFNSSTPNLHLINLKYAQRPPDDLIEILGMIIEMNSNAKQRQHERIDIGVETIETLGLKSANSVILIGNEKKSCIIRDLSYYGAKIITTGITDNCEGKEIKFVVPFTGDLGNCILDGNIARCEPIKTKESFSLVGVHFIEERVAMGYIKTLKDFFDKKDKIKPEEKDKSS